jgi:hypothetical protein
MAVSAIHFTNENASFAPAASPVSGARRSGRVIIAIRVKILPIFGKALDRKNLLSKFKRSGQ